MATDHNDVTEKKQLASSAAQEMWSVFICYRQDDGKEIAQWLSDNLHERQLSVPGRDTEIGLDVYFDQTAAAIDDWTRLHQPALERSRAMLFVCTPGARSSFGADDWVHKELGWWLDNRDVAPIIIDPYDSERWIPDPIKERWPQPQRVLVQPQEWDKLSDVDRQPLERNARDRLIRGLKESEQATTHEDLERARERTRLLEKQKKRLNFMLGVSVTLFCAAVLSAGYSAMQAAKLREQNVSLAAASIVQDFDTDSTFSQRERKRIWELALAEENLREAAIGHFLSSSRNSRAFIAHEHYLKHALLRMNPESRAAPVTSALSTHCVDALTVSQFKICATLAPLQWRLPEKLSMQLVTEIVRDGTSASEIGDIVEVVADLGGRVDRESALFLSEQLVTAMEQEGIGVSHLIALSDALGMLGELADRSQIRRAAQQVVKAMEQVTTNLPPDLPDADVKQLAALSRLGSTFQRLGKEIDQSLLQRAGSNLLSLLALERSEEQETPFLDQYAQQLADIGAWLDTESAQAIGELLVTAMQQGANTQRQIPRFSNVFASIVDRVDQNLVQQAAQLMVSAMEQENTDSRLLRIYAEGLAGLGERVDQNLVQQAGLLLVMAMEQETTDWSVIRLYVESLVGLGDRVDQHQLRRAGLNVINWTAPEGVNARQRAGLERNSWEAFDSLGQRMNGESARLLSEKLVLAMEQGATAESFGRLIDVFSRLSDQLDAKSANALGNRLLSLMSREGISEGRRRALMRVFAGLGDRLELSSVRLGGLQIITMMGTKRNASVLLALFSNILSFGDRLDQSLVQGAALKVLVQIDLESLSVVRSNLKYEDYLEKHAILAARLDEAGAKVVGERLVKAMEERGASDRELGLNSFIFTGVGERLDAETAKALGARLLTAMEQNGDSTDELIFFSRAIGAVGDRLDPGLMHRAGSQILSIMNQAGGTEEDLRDCIIALASLGDSVDQIHLQRAGLQLVSAIEQGQVRRRGLRTFVSLNEQLDANSARLLGERLVASVEKGGTNSGSSQYLGFTQALTYLYERLDAKSAQALGQRIVTELNRPTLSPESITTLMSAFCLTANNSVDEECITLGLDRTSRIQSNMDSKKFDRYKFAKWASAPGREFDTSALPPTPSYVFGSD